MAKKSSKISKVTPFTIFCWIGFAVFLFFLAFYAYYMLSTSFKDPFGGINYYADNILGLPKFLQFDQYVNAWNRFRVQLVDSSWVYIEEMLIYSFAFAMKSLTYFSCKSISLIFLLSTFSFERICACSSS